MFAYFTFFCYNHIISVGGVKRREGSSRYEELRRRRSTGGGVGGGRKHDSGERGVCGEEVICIGRVLSRMSPDETCER